MITASDLEKYHAQGFLVIPDFVSANICNKVVAHTNELISAFEIRHANTIFSTKTSAHVKDDYFLSSGDKMHFFFEERALDAHGKLIKDKKFAINKIGHALHDIDPIFNLFSRTHKIARLTAALGIEEAQIVQSMYICKSPWIGGEVRPHQDSTFLYTDGKPITGLWFALEDATIENGCLWAIPGVHQKLKSRFFRDADNTTRLETYDDSVWPLEQMIPLEVSKGSLIVLHGLLPHMSKENKSNYSRHAYTLHLKSKSDYFSGSNWLQSNKPFSSLLL